MPNEQRFLVSVDGGTGLIYHHSGLSSTIVESFANPGADEYGITILNTAGNLISTDTSKIYVHSGVSSTITTSYAVAEAIYLTGLALDSSINLISGNISNDASPNRIFVHAGISGTLSTSFQYDTAADAEPYGLVVNASFDLISCSVFPSARIRIHAGISNTVSSFFATEDTMGSQGLALDHIGNLISNKFTSSPGRIYQHSGITSVITSSFNSPADDPRGMAYHTPFYAFVQSSTTVSVPGDLESVKGKCTLTENIPPSSGWMVAYEPVITGTYQTYGFQIYTGISTAEYIAFHFASNYRPEQHSPNAFTIDSSGNFISVDGNTDTIWVHGGANEVLETSFSAPSTSTQGLTIDPTTQNLISCDPVADQVYIHSGISSVVLSQFGSPGTSIADVSVISTGNLVSHDYGVVYIHAGVSGSITGSFEVVSGSVRTAVDSEDNLLVAEAFSAGMVLNKVYRHSGLSNVVLQTLSWTDRYGPEIIVHTLVLGALLNRDHIDGATTLSLFSQPGDNLVSTDLNLKKIYIHLQLTGIITSSFAGPIPDYATEGLTVTSDGNLISSNTTYIFRHSGVSATVIDSFSAPLTYALGLTMDPDGNLLGGALDLEGYRHIYQHSGFSSTITTSFIVDQFIQGIMIDAGRNLIAVAAGNGSTSPVYRYAGVGTTITSSFSADAGLASDAAIDSTGRLLLSDPWDQRIYIHSGVSSTVLMSFASPGTTPLALTSDQLIAYASVTTTLGHMKSRAVARVIELAYLSAATEVMYQGRGFVLSRALLRTTGNYLISGSSPNGVYQVSTSTGAIQSSFSTSYTPQSLCLDVNENLLGVSQSESVLYRHNGANSAQILSSFSLPAGAGQAYGVAIDLSGNLLSTGAGVVYLHNGVTSTVLSSFMILGMGTIGGIEVDGSGNLLSADTTNSKVNVHSGLTGTITSSFSVTSAANLISTNTSGFIRIHSGVTNTVASSFASPGTEPVGISLDSSGNLISIDQNNVKVYLHSGITSTISSSFTCPDTTPTGASLTAAGNLLTAGRQRDFVYVHSGVTSTITDSFSGGPNTTGITVTSGGNLLSTYLNAPRRVYTHSGISGAIASSFSYPYTTPQDLTLDDLGNLLVADSGDFRVYQFSGVTSTLLSSFSLVSPWGLTLQPATNLSPAGILFSTLGDLILLTPLQIRIYDGTSSTVDATVSITVPNALGLEYAAPAVTEIPYLKARTTLARRSTHVKGACLVYVEGREELRFFTELSILESVKAFTELAVTAHIKGSCVLAIQSEELRFFTELSIKESVKAFTELAVTAHAEGACAVYHADLGYLKAFAQAGGIEPVKSATLVGIRGDLITGNIQGWVYIHSGISSILRTSWMAAAGGGGLTADFEGNILLGKAPTAYLHNGLLSTVQSSFALPWGTKHDFDTLAVPWNTGTLISCDTSTIYVHSGIGSTITGSFAAPGAPAVGIATTRVGDLVSWEQDTASIYLHSGISGIVVSSFVLPGVTVSSLNGGGITVDPGSGDLVAQLNLHNVVRRYLGTTGTTKTEFAVPSTLYRLNDLHVLSMTLEFFDYEHIKSSTTLIPTVTGTLISGDKNTNKIYIHSGISEIVRTSFAGLNSAGVTGLSMTPQNNLISIYQGVTTFYIHEGISGAVSSTFDVSPHTNDLGVAVDLAGNLISGEWGLGGGVYKLFVHSGVTNTIVSSFDSPQTSGGSPQVGGLAVDPDGNLISAVVGSPWWGQQSKVTFHSGVSATIVSYFENAQGAAESQIHGVTIEPNGNLITCDTLADQIRLHLGKTSTILTRFPSPGVNPSDLTLLPDQRNMVIVAVRVQAIELSHARGATELLVVAREYVLGACNVVQGVIDHTQGACTLAVKEHVRAYSSLALKEHVIGACAVTSGFFDHVRGACTLAVKEHIQGSVELAHKVYVQAKIDLVTYAAGILVSCDATSKKIYVHDGLTGAVSTSFLFAGTTPNGLAVTGEGNLLACDVSGNKVYSYSGVSSTVTDSFSLPYSSPSGLGVDASENLVSCSQGSAKIYVHSGITGTVTASFSAPDTSGGGAIPTGLACDGSGNLISAVTSGHFWGNQTKVSIHAGVTSTVTGSFENATGGTSLLLTGVEVDEGGNLVTCDITSGLIRRHMGETLSVFRSFTAPGTEPSGLGIRDPLTGRDYAKSLTDLFFGTRESAMAAVLLEVQTRAYVQAGASIISGLMGEHVNAAVTLQIDIQDSIKAFIYLDFPGTREYVSAQAAVMADARDHLISRTELASVFTAVDYYRDARDFRGMLGAYAAGSGYGYDAYDGAWTSSGGHGADYNSARHLTAADPTTNVEDTTFSDTYVNRENLPPADRITGFQSADYYVWIYVNGGTTNQVHGVTVGGNPEVRVASGGGTWRWRQVGTGTYAITNSTQFWFHHVNTDGYLHAIRGIYLKSTPGMPSLIPGGQTGDDTITYSVQLGHLKSATTLQVDTRESVKGRASVVVQGQAFAQGGCALAIQEHTKARTYLDGEPRWSHVIGATQATGADLSDVKARTYLDGEPRQDHLQVATTLAPVQWEHVKARTYLDGELKSAHIKGSAIVAPIVVESAKGLCEISSHLLQDSFNIFQGGVFYLSDAFSVRSSAAIFLLQDSFDIVEEVSNNFRDIFNVISTAGAISRNSDVQIIVLGTSI